MFWFLCGCVCVGLGLSLWHLSAVFYAPGWVLPFPLRLQRRAATPVDYHTLTASLRSERIMLLAQTGVEFLLLGEQGRIYTVVFSTTPSCSCPAFIYKKADCVQCKHLAWVKLRLMSMPANHYFATQETYLPWEQRYLLSQVKPRAFAPPPIRDAVAGTTHQRERTAGDVCAICYEEPTDPTERCAGQCQQEFHAACVESYIKFQQSEGTPAVCACCRSPWLSRVVVESLTDRTGSWRIVSHPLGAFKRPRPKSVKRPRGTAPKI